MIESLIYLVLYLVVIGVIVWLLLYLIDAVPVPEPFHRVARVAIIVISVLIVIVLLLQFVGALSGAPPRLLR